MDEKTEGLIKTIAQELAAALGGELVSLALFGSAAGEDYQPGRSDLNFLVVVRKADLAALGRLGAVLRRRRRPRVAPPLVLTSDDLRRSLDSYPLELMEIKFSHRLLAGEDLLTGLEFDPGDLRLQCEREVRGKLIQLRRGLMEAGTDHRALATLFEASLKSFKVIIRGVLRLEGENAGGGRGLLEAMARKLGRKLPAMGRIAEMSRGGKAGKEELRALGAGYLEEVESLADFIDAWRPAGGDGR